MKSRINPSANPSYIKTALLIAASAAALNLSGCKQTTRSTAPASPSQEVSVKDAASTDSKNEVSETQLGDAPQHSEAMGAQQTTSTQDRAAQMLTGGSSQATIQQAKEFLEAAATELEVIGLYESKAAWVNATYLTDDTAWLLAKASTESSKIITRLSNEAKRFNDLKLPVDMARKMDFLKRSTNFPAPGTEGAAEQLAKVSIKLDSTYSTGKFSYRSDDPQFASYYEGLSPDEAVELSLTELSNIIAKSRNPEELKTVWEGWRTVSPVMKNDYSTMVDIVNEGSRELGYADTGALWRAGYDMPADDFTAEADRLWSQVKPLYDDLHCYVRAELNEEYGDEVVPLDAPIRADLLGNMWAQSWDNIYDIVKPDVTASNLDVTSLLEAAEYDAEKMVRTGEGFFSSLGFDPLPQTFWDRSIITKPADRDIVCHASAWGIDGGKDIRIKMCTQVDGGDFQTVHHELGHSYYQRAYKDQSVFYQNGANDGFHEAIGDMIALSITPDYLVNIGLLDEANTPSAESDIDLLMKQALNKVAFLPFGLLVDQWRWKVFSGEYSPEEYNSGWWDLRETYQGIRAPGERPADAFDPGAKYHIPGNTPYMRYFLAHILQFQFHESACKIAEYEGPLHRCSIYGNKDVGAKFDAMLQMGASKPWPDALEAFTGTRKMDGEAILSYFKPLQTYLKAQNKDRNCGWQ